VKLNATASAAAAAAATAPEPTTPAAWEVSPGR